jgi:hypothetical protein
LRRYDTRIFNILSFVLTQNERTKEKKFVLSIILAHSSRALPEVKLQDGLQLFSIAKKVGKNATAVKLLWRCLRAQRK